MEKKRFYCAKSQLYGVTVYDRTSQKPAWEYGACIGMDEVAATMLTVRLNRLDRLDGLGAYHQQMKDLALWREVGK